MKHQEPVNDNGIFKNIMKLTRIIYDSNMMVENYVDYKHFKKSMEVFCQTIGTKKVLAYINNMRLKIVE